MKRIACLLLALLMLAGCAGQQDPGTSEQSSTGSTDDASTDSSTGDSTGSSTDSSTGDSTGDSTGTSEDSSETPVVYRHPLNGQPLDAPWTGRATAVVINNIQAALPQYGINQADIIYELETEGGITRLLAIYSDLSKVGTIGPVRSARTFYNNIALSHDAVLIHCGGSEASLKGQYSDNSDTISNWEHINEQHNGSYFFRDRDRYNSGYAWEHTLFTKGEELLRGLKAKKYEKTYEGGYNHGLTFTDKPELSGERAETITVIHRGKKTTTMTYNAEKGVYAASQYGKPWMDAGANEQLQFRNVVVLYTDQWSIRDSAYSRSYFQLSGTGEGHFACDGQIVPIVWHRDELRGSFTYTLKDGTPLVMGEGSTYVSVVAKSRQPVSYQ
ncbi:MAG: DUF3048 domain-containing protein [Oscillospiraceae bacterium]|nr:DUF3048 domain-containing protein [Oscillospiraceae bacterium]